MNLMSISKPATGFTFDGTLMAVSQLQAFVAESGFDINSMSINSTNQGAMKFTVSMSYFKVIEGNPNINYMQLTMKPDFVVVAQSDQDFLQAMTAEQLESNYTVVV